MNKVFPAYVTSVVARMASVAARQDRLTRTIKDPNGSMILIALMVLTLMSIIGIASINTVVTESFIVRNAAIRKQNIQLADAVAGEALQRVLDAGLLNNSANDDPSDLELELSPQDPSHLTWVLDPAVWDASGNADDWWNPAFAGRLLDATNSEAPTILTRDIDGAMRNLLITRGEWTVGGDPDDSPVRYALLGWRAAPGSSLKLTVASRRAGEVLTEYVSDTHGVTRLAIGLERDFFN